MEDEGPREKEPLLARQTPKGELKLHAHTEISWVRCLNTQIAHHFIDLTTFGEFKVVCTRLSIRYTFVSYNPPQLRLDLYQAGIKSSRYRGRIQMDVEL